MNLKVSNLIYFFLSLLSGWPSVKWLIKRLAVLVVTVFTAITINFFLVRMMPGNPIDILINEYMSLGMSYEEAAAAVAAIVPFIPTKPLHEQYIDYIIGILSGNLGKSISLAQPVTLILMYAIPWTVFIVSISLMVSFSIGIVAGMYMAYRRGGLLDKALSIFASVTSGFPSYAIGVLLAITLGVKFKIFPYRGAYDYWVKPGFNLEFIVSVFSHAILPVMTYVVTTVGGWMLAMKSSTTSVLGEYYVKTAEARGLPDRRIILTYVGRNAILPLFTRLTISLGYMFGGVVFIETIFSYPGIGRYLSVSISRRDYILMSGCFLVTTVAVIAANFLADLLYSKLDPRIKLGEE